MSGNLKSPIAVGLPREEPHPGIVLLLIE
ncbi:MAG: 3 kDa unknown protein [Tomato albetovirus 1]|nr:MAG: 3 kDa unknown protein [Tomato albetovirus 1]